MASITVKGTYALDPETVAQLERMARRWGVSKSEALRRAIRQAAAKPASRAKAVAALDRLQEAAKLTDKQATVWARQVRSERRAQRPRPPKRK